MRAYANLPSEVPDSLLDQHLSGAELDVRRRAGFLAPPPGFEPIWDEAICAKALANALPWLNTFALDGAAKVGRLEGTVEFRFLTPDDVDARSRRLMARYDELMSALPGADAQTDAVRGVAATGFTLDAI